MSEEFKGVRFFGVNFDITGYCENKPESVKAVYQRYIVDPDVAHHLCSFQKNRWALAVGISIELQEGLDRDDLSTEDQQWMDEVECSECGDDYIAWNVEFAYEDDHDWSGGGELTEDEAEEAAREDHRGNWYF